MSRIASPALAGMRLSILVHLYRVRLRSHAVQELLAGSGIAVGVALMLGVLVANTSLTGSAAEIVHEIVGHARVQLAARSPAGFDERLLRSVGRLPTVQATAPVLRENVAVLGPRGRSSLQLVGVTDGIVAIGGLGAHALLGSGVRIGQGLVLPATIAAAVGVQEPGQTVTVLAFGSAHTARVGGIVGSSRFAALASSPVALAPLAMTQRLTGMPNRVTQVLIVPRRGAEASLSASLRGLAAGRLDVAPADHELRLLDEAMKPNAQSTSLFAAISVMVGFLLALNAMLLTVPERRRAVADLRMQGYDWRQILALLCFQALVLGVAASAVGVLLGDLVSHAFLNRVPAYLNAAFPIGTRQTLGATTVALALGCGVLATMVASLSPAFDLRPWRATDAILRDRAAGGEVLAHHTVLALSSAGAASTLLIVGAVLVEPAITIAGGVALALGTLLLIPGVFAASARLLRWLGERVGSSALIVVVSELRVTTTRSVALAGIAGLAVYGSVAIGGARGDLIRGLDRNFGEYLDTAQLWVTTGGNDLTTNSFRAQQATTALARLPQLASVRSYQGGFLDVGPRRLWIVARPSGERSMIPASQLVRGELAHASALLRGGGWATVSGAFADEHHLRVGAGFTLPTPTGDASFRVAAITTNLGWSPGAVVMSSADYRRLWQSDDPAAIEVDLRPGVSALAGRALVAATLATTSPGLSVQTLAQRRAEYASDSRQGLRALGEIDTLLVVSAALAVACALSAALWQRRGRLASLKIQGYDSAQLWRALLLESVVVLAVGCCVGAAVGILGHALASRWLRLATGFPAPFDVGFAGVFLTLALLAVIALAVIGWAGLAAARAPARASLQE